MIILGMLIAFFNHKIKFSLNKDVIPDNVITRHCAKLFFFYYQAHFKKNMCDNSLNFVITQSVPKHWLEL